MLVEGSSTIATAHGQTLTIDVHTLNFDANSITIGAAGQDGTVQFQDGGSAAVNNPGVANVTIAAGTLKALDITTAILLNDASTTIDTGATLDANGNSLGFSNTPTSALRRLTSRSGRRGVHHSRALAE